MGDLERLEASRRGVCCAIVGLLVGAVLSSGCGSSEHVAAQATPDPSTPAQPTPMPAPVQPSAPPEPTPPPPPPQPTPPPGPPPTPPQPTPTPPPSPTPEPVLPPLSSSPDGTLPVLWEVSLPADGYVRDTLAVDGGGNLYWVERRRSQERYADALVSTDADGAERWRTQLGGPTMPIGGACSDPLVAGDLAVLEVCGGTLVAFATGDGHTVWQRQLFRPDASARMQAPAASGDSVVVSTTTSTGKSVQALDRPTGAIRWALTLPSPASDASEAGQPVLDEAGNAYVVVGQNPGELVSIDGRGVERFRRALSSGEAVIAVGAGGVVTTRGIRSASDGTTLVNVDPLQTSGSVSKAVVGQGAVFAIAQGSPTRPILMVRQPVAATPSDWTVVLAEPLPGGEYGKAFTMESWPVLTSLGTILLVERRVSVYDAMPAPALRELKLDGTDAGRAALPPGGCSDAFALSAGRLFCVAGSASSQSQQVIRALGVPARAPATEGWVTYRGSMARDARAR